MPRPTKRFGGLVLGAGVLFAIGTNIQSGWLLVLSSLLLGAATAGLVLPPRMVRHLRIERRAPAEVFQGQPANVDLLVANAGRGMRLSVVLEDEHLAGIRVLAPSMRPGERVALSTERAASRRGAHESSTVWVSSSAPFGVAVARRRLEVPSRTIVFPAVVPIRQLPVVDGPPDVDRSAVPRPRRGAGPEYLGVRDYHVGDSLRHVHWRRRRAGAR